MKSPELRQVIRETIIDYLKEMDGETNKKPSDYFSSSSENGSTWKTASGKFGAKNLAGKIKYFPADKEQTAQQFARSRSEMNKSVNYRKR